CLISHHLPSAHHRRPLHSFPTRRSSDLSTACSAASKARISPARTCSSSRTPRPRATPHSPQWLPPGKPARTLSAWRRSWTATPRSEEHTSELQSRFDLVCRLLLEKKNQT